MLFRLIIIFVGIIYTTRFAVAQTNIIEPLVIDSSYAIDSRNIVLRQSGEIRLLLNQDNIEFLFNRQIYTGAHVIHYRSDKGGEATFIAKFDGLTLDCKNISRTDKELNFDYDIKAKLIIEIAKTDGWELTTNNILLNGFEFENKIIMANNSNKITLTKNLPIKIF